MLAPSGYYLKPATMFYKTLLALIVFLSSHRSTIASTLITASTPHESNDQTLILASVNCNDRHGSLSLNFRSVGLQRIHSDFVNSPNISCLSLEDNEIDYVSPNAFRLTPNLIYLNLAQNNLSLTNISDLSSHSQLRTLILDNQSADSDSSFKLHSTFPRLLHLYLRNNSLKELTSLAFAPKLTHLYLSSNSLGDSELAFLDDAPESLQVLDLGSNGLRSLNPSKLASLRELWLDDNRIGAICGKSSCDDSALVLEAADSLEILSVTGNGLTSIESDAFNDAENLRDLDLSDNRIDSIRKGTFGRANSLLNLSLKGNQLSEMPDLCGPELLEFLTLANNSLEIVKKESFCLMKGLRFIDLSDNKIRTIEGAAFDEQVNLTELRLSNNLLTIFPSKWLFKLTNLQVLHVEGNRLKRLNDLELSSVRNAGKLRRVYFQNNPITKIYTGSVYTAFRGVPNITIELFDAGQSARLEQNDSDIETCKCECDSDNDKLNSLDDILDSLDEI